MYRHTLVLPETDPDWSAAALEHLLRDFRLITMMVFGASGRAPEVVGWADMLAEREQVPAPGGGVTFVRHVVWVRDPSAAALQPIIGPVLAATPIPLVAVLNFGDQLRARIDAGPVTVLDLENAFLRGHAS